MDISELPGKAEVRVSSSSVVRAFSLGLGIAADDDGNESLMMQIFFSGEEEEEEEKDVEREEE